MGPLLFRFNPGSTSTSPPTVGQAKPVAFTEEGLHEAERLFREPFAARR
jgi:hypothetical protein